MTEEEFHKKMGARFFNETWKLLDQSSRTAEEDAQMIHLAHGSRLHWGFVGNAQNLAVGEWQIARVYSVLNRPEPALYHAKRSVQIAEENNFEGFYQASAYEGMARALATANDPSASEFIAKAKAIAQTIREADDRALIESDLANVKVPSQ